MKLAVWYSNASMMYIVESGVYVCICSHFLGRVHWSDYGKLGEVYAGGGAFGIGDGDGDCGRNEKCMSSARVCDAKAQPAQLTYACPSFEYPAECPG